MTETTAKAGPIGRTLRLFVAVCLLIILVPVLLEAGWAYNLRSLALVVALALLYALLHLAVSRYLPAINRWLGAVLALVPLFLMWLFGQGGGPLFGQGEGGTAAIAFLTVSLLIDVFRADAGCEVMAIPGLVFRDRTHLPCIAFSPIDFIESRRPADES